MDIELHGMIVDDQDKEIYQWFGYSDIISPGDIRVGLAAAAGEDVTIKINSPGGYLIAGAEIFSLLREYAGGTIGHIQSHAASAATVAMMGCDIVAADPTAAICVHNPSTNTAGDYQEHQRSIASLKAFKDTILNAYMLRAKAKREEISSLMNEDRWMAVQEALEYGLIDEITGGEPPGEGKVMNSMACPAITQKMRDLFFAAKNEKETPNHARASALFELLSR